MPCPIGLFLIGWIEGDTECQLCEAMRDSRSVKRAILDPATSWGIGEEVVMGGKGSKERHEATTPDCTRQGKEGMEQEKRDQEEQRERKGGRSDSWNRKMAVHWDPSVILDRTGGKVGDLIPRKD